MKFVSLTLVALLPLLSCSHRPDKLEQKPGTQAKSVRILFIGNSHTGNCDVPGMVRQMMESDGTGTPVYTESIFTAFLEDAGQNVQTQNRIKNGKWDIVICQAVKLSSSHQYSYPHDGAIKIAKLAADTGAKTYLFAEWPRKGWDETEYILGVYQQVAQASGVKVIPVCRAWDIALKKNPNLDLWLQDGNHSSPLGAYLASGVIYYWLLDGIGQPRYIPAGLVSRTATQMLAIAKETHQQYGK
ncbi:MAG: hypothetical protein KF784_08095 [Fimbriimonadaceae bacterium]|nr:hypothetical protein [Fimbriimonadaceae bacterium]